MDWRCIAILNQIIYILTDHIPIIQEFCREIDALATRLPCRQERETDSRRRADGQRPLPGGGIAEAVITSATADGIRTITIDRPERRNALTREGLDALETAIGAASEPVVLLRGAGEAFCAGADLDEVRGLDGPEEARAFARHGQRVARALATYDGAVVAGIDGAARGGGVELALACDLRVCTPRSTFAETGTSVGLFGAWGGTVRLPAVVGRGVAMDLTLSARVVDAEQARRVGLVSRIVEDPRAVAAEIADNDAAAIRAVTRILQAGVDEGHVAAQERREREAFADLVAGGAPRRKG